MEKNTNMELTVAIKEVVKEAVREVLAEAGILTNKAVKEIAKDTAPAKEVAKETAKETAKDTAKKEADQTPTPTGDREAELKGMKYNDLKALVSKLGGKAVGKAPDLIAQILELEAKAGSPAPDADADKDDEAGNTPEDNGDDAGEEDNTQEFIDFLGELEKDDLLEIGAKLEVKKPKAFKKDAYITLLVADVDALYTALEELGYYDEEGSEEAGDDSEAEGEEVSVADQLAEKSVEELAEICTANGLSAKGKKQALVDRIVKAVEAGEISLDGEADEAGEEEGEGDAWYTQEELEAMEVKELEDLAKEYEVEVPTKKVGKKTVTDKAKLVEALVALGEAEDTEDAGDAGDAGDDAEGEDGEEFEASQERLDKEGEIEDKIRAQYKAKKLKDATIKKFLEAYNDGEEVDLDKEEALDRYVEIKTAFVDDDAEVHEGEDCYIRNGEYFCCGKQLEEVDGAPYCTVCGTTYEA